MSHCFPQKTRAGFAPDRVIGSGYHYSGFVLALRLARHDDITAFNRYIVALSIVSSPMVRSWNALLLTRNLPASSAAIPRALGIPGTELLPLPEA